VIKKKAIIIAASVETILFMIYLLIFFYPVTGAGRYSLHHFSQNLFRKCCLHSVFLPDKIFAHEGYSSTSSNGEPCAEPGGVIPRKAAIVGATSTGFPIKSILG
jgi:hypothetical protein